jgi:hypothetical protein
MSFRNLERRMRRKKMKKKKMNLKPKYQLFQEA